MLNSNPETQETILKKNAGEKMQNLRKLCVKIALKMR